MKRMISFALCATVAASAWTGLAEEKTRLPAGAESPVIVGHRGSRGEYDDNAAGGFAKSLAAGVRSFETDIRMTKDYGLVIMHDAKVERTTTGKGVVEEMTKAEVTALKLKKSGENVPSLEDVLAVFKGRKDVRIELEMKTFDKWYKEGDNRATYCRLIHDTAVRMMEPGTYVFTSFDTNTLAKMKAIFPDAPTTMITGKPVSRALVDQAVSLGCLGMAPALRGTKKEDVDYAHSKGLCISLWMMQNYRDYALNKSLGGDTGTTDFPMKLKQAISAKKRLVCLDLDATLCQHRSPMPPENRAALDELMKRYKCIMVGAGNAPRIYKQMENYPIDIIGNYGMQESKIIDGKFTIVKQLTEPVDKAFFLEKAKYLREKYGYTDYAGESVEFHPSGMVTFGLLGTKPDQAAKLKFDPDRKKRQKMYPEVLKIFKDYSVYIGGSTSFDFAGKQYNKYDAIMAYAKENGYKLEEIVFIGDDFGDGGGDSHVRIKGMDYIEIEDYRKFPERIKILLDK
ncbi:MAG: HAD hydrolase family protein [Kiritimatiellae bacterium]|nr:HAD hydrolase family protein [Kiritimatiellia bacterium]